MLGHGRLRDPELLLDRAADLARAALAVGDQLEDPAAHGITEHLECVHQAEYISSDLYKTTLAEARAAVSWPGGWCAGPVVPGRCLAAAACSLAAS